MAFLNNHDITESNLIIPRGLLRWLGGGGWLAIVHRCPTHHPDELKLK